MASAPILFFPYRLRVIFALFSGLLMAEPATGTVAAAAPAPPKAPARVVVISDDLRDTPNGATAPILSLLPYTAALADP